MRLFPNGGGWLSIAIFATSMLCSPAIAELSIEVSAAKSVQTITPETVTQVVAEDGTNIGEPIREVGEPIVKEGQPAALVSLTCDRDLSDASNVLVRLKCATAKATVVKPGLYLFDTPGTHVVEVMVLGQNPLSIDEETISVTIGKPVPPVPPEPPTPDVPEDRFENIGQRAAKWAAGLPSRQEAAKVFVSHAELLRSDPSHTINSVSKSLSSALSVAPWSASYVEFRKMITADLAQRWDRDRLGRVDLADYYSAVALGIGGAK